MMINLMTLEPAVSKPINFASFAPLRDANGICDSYQHEDPFVSVNDTFFFSRKDAKNFGKKCGAEVYLRRK
jgi:hypothetical protein